MTKLTKPNDMGTISKDFSFSEFEDSKIAEEGLTFSNVDFSDCIMIGVGRVSVHID